MRKSRRTQRLPDQRMKSIAGIERQLLDLPTLDRAALQSCYEHHLKRLPEVGASDEAMRLAITCRLQKILVARLQSRLMRRAPTT